MSNSWFQFRQFRMEQDRCAMKITTDACIQGAWAPIPPHVCHVLDIGAGTGLLSLMLAQRNPTVIIDAIEYDEAAAQQATENISAAPWHNRIQIIHGDARHYSSEKKYDLIICNPPFFTDSLLGPKHNKNLARHTISLSATELITIVKNNLATQGSFCILLPYAEYLSFKATAENSDLHELHTLHVKHTPNAATKRVVSILSSTLTPPSPPETLIIKNEEGEYTAAFATLLSPFYLNL